MRLILVRIPANTSKQDIARFVEPALQRRLSIRKKKIEKIEILKLHDKNINAIEYHGLVTIEPDSLAIRAILKLNRKAINGKHIAVRQYHKRYWHNDPRQKSPSLNLKYPERRTLERRRYHLQELDEIEVRLTGHKSFHRTF